MSNGISSGKNDVLLNLENDAVITLWKSLRHGDAVCMDVDSTAVEGEFIDELAEFLGVGDKVREVTLKAMGGGMDFRTALRNRLAVMQPSREDVAKYKKLHPPKLTTGIKGLVGKLQKLGVDVYLVSGGFDALIFPVAELLGIPQKNVFANTLVFQEDGKFLGFDEEKPTSQPGGKALAVRSIMHKKSYRYVVMVGDGATDAEACPPAHAFIGFGGNVVREAVKEKSHLYVHSFEELSELLSSNEETRSDVQSNGIH